MPLRKTRPGAGGWALAALAIVFAGAATGSAFDRRTKANPLAETAVPALFRGQAEIARGRKALVEGDAAAAQDAARNTITAMPVAAAGPALLGTALALSQDAQGADAAFRVAAAGGWRDILTQAYWARQSELSGEWDMAAVRVDAILRANPAFPGADALRAPLEADPNGRSALAAKMDYASPWVRTYFTPGGQVGKEQLARRVPVMLAFAEARGPVGCDRSASAVRALVNSGSAALGRTLWQAHCPQANAASGIVDSSFARAGAGRPDPFGWTLHPDGNVSVTVDGDGDSRSLVAQNRSGRARLVASQPVGLASGSALIAWQASENGKPSERVDISVYCGRPRRPAMSGGDRRQVTVSGCEGETLGVWLDGGQGRVTIDRVSVAD